MTSQSEWPQGAPKPQGEDLVQVVMTENMARLFESECLAVGLAHLAGPMLFRDDDLPTYTIGVGP